MVPGDYPLHEFYGVIGTRPSFGAGKLYPDFNNQWKSRGHDQVSVSILRKTGPGCTKQLKMKWEFLQPFPVFQRIFLDGIMDHLADGGLKNHRKHKAGAKKSAVTQGTVVEIPTLS